MHDTHDLNSWWISPLFAHRAGIVDSGSSDGGIVSDAVGAYAVIMTDGDEIPGPTPESFQYRARDRDPGRYRLTAGTPESRHPIRILRSHSLHSFWKPRAGLRYDGLCVEPILIFRLNRPIPNAYGVSLNRIV